MGLRKGEPHIGAVALAAIGAESDGRLPIRPALARIAQYEIGGGIRGAFERARDEANAGIAHPAQSSCSNIKAPSSPAAQRAADGGRGQRCSGVDGKPVR